MQALQLVSCDVDLTAIRLSIHRLAVASCICSVSLYSLTLSAQETDSTPTARNTFSFSSAYVANDYANNMDYVQFDLDLITASSRLSLYGYEKFSNYINGGFSRFAYYAASQLLVEATGIFLTYHEWGHADRTVAMGGTASISGCLTKGQWCSAPRDFLSYSSSQFFRFDNSGGLVTSSGKLTANAESGKSIDSIVSGAGVTQQSITFPSSTERCAIKQRRSGHLCVRCLKRTSLRH